MTKIEELLIQAVAEPNPRRGGHVLCERNGVLSLEVIHGDGKTAPVGVLAYINHSFGKSRLRSIMESVVARRAGFALTDHIRPSNPANLHIILAAGAQTWMPYNDAEFLAELTA